VDHGDAGRSGGGVGVLRWCNGSGSWSKKVVDSRAMGAGCKQNRAGGRGYACVLGLKKKSLELI